MSLSTYILHAMCVVFSNFRNRPLNHKITNVFFDRLTLSGLPRLRVQGSWLTVCAFRVGSLVEEAKEGRPAHTHSHAFNPTTPCARCDQLRHGTNPLLPAPFPAFASIATPKTASALAATTLATTVAAPAFSATVATALATTTVATTVSAALAAARAPSAHRMRPRWLHAALRALGWHDHLWRNGRQVCANL